MTTRCIKTDLVHEGREQHDFGVVDKKGRAVGAFVALHCGTFTPGVRDNGDSTSYDADTEPGGFFAWCGTATRGGEVFGPSQGWRYCKTERERFEQIEKYLAGAKARAFRNFS